MLYPMKRDVSVVFSASYAERQVVGWGQFCHIFNETTLITLMFDKRCKKVVEAVAKLRITCGRLNTFNNKIMRNWNKFNKILPLDGQKIIVWDSGLRKKLYRTFNKEFWDKTHRCLWCSHFCQHWKNT